MIRNYLIAALAAALLAASAWSWTQAREIDALSAQNVALRLALTAAAAKQTNITEDRDSDARIDNIPDDGLRSVPDHWLRPQTDGGGLY